MMPYVTYLWLQNSKKWRRRKRRREERRGGIGGGIEKGEGEEDSLKQPRGAKKIHELKNTATKAQSFDVTYFVEN